jgi:hypothetical protein
MLMALRVHGVQKDANRAPASPSLMPSWFSGDDWKLTSIVEPTTLEEDRDEVRFPSDEVPEKESGDCRRGSISGVGSSQEGNKRLMMEE